MFSKNTPAYGLVHRVQKHGLFVQNDVRIVGNAARDGKDVLKQREPAVVAAYPKNIVFDIFYLQYMTYPSSVSFASIIPDLFQKETKEWLNARSPRGAEGSAPPGPYSGKSKYALALL